MQGPTVSCRLIIGLTGAYLLAALATPGWVCVVAILPAKRRCIHLETTAGAPYFSHAGQRLPLSQQSSIIAGPVIGNVTASASISGSRQPNQRPDHPYAPVGVAGQVSLNVPSMRRPHPVTPGLQPTPLPCRLAICWVATPLVRVVVTVVSL